MKKVRTFLAIGAVASIMASCAAMSASPVSGYLYSDVSAPLTATSNNVGSKVGTAEAKSILGAIGIGDASIEAAAKKAGITKISHVDYKSTNILGIYATYTVMVYGE